MWVLNQSPTLLTLLMLLPGNTRILACTLFSVAAAGPVVKVVYLTPNPNTFTVGSAAFLKLEARDATNLKVSTSLQVRVRTTGSAVLGSEYVTLSAGSGSVLLTDEVSESVQLSIVEGPSGLDISSTQTLTFRPGEFGCL